MPDGSFYLRNTNDTGAVSLMRMTYGSDNSANGVNGVQSYIPVTAGHSYKFTTCIKASVSTTFSLLVDWYDPVGTFLSTTTNTLVTVATTWVRVGAAITLVAPTNATHARVHIQAAAAMAINATVGIFKPMFADLAWRPEGIPSLQNTIPLSSVSSPDVGTFVHQDYYEPPREVKVNLYPNRTNFAFNSDFLLNNLPPGAWSAYDAPSYGQLPIAYDDYTDIIDAPPDWETS
jgi:hypothetical protein